jgi:hypothetical protein
VIAIGELLLYKKGREKKSLIDHIKRRKKEVFIIHSINNI